MLPTESLKFMTTDGENEAAHTFVDLMGSWEAWETARDGWGWKYQGKTKPNWRILNLGT